MVSSLYRNPDGIDSCLLNRLSAASTDGGLQDPIGAEIHAIVRSHGQPVADFTDSDFQDLETQLNQTELLTGCQQGNQCQDVQFTVHLPDTNCTDGTEDECHTWADVFWFDDEVALEAAFDVGWGETADFAGNQVILDSKGHTAHSSLWRSEDSITLIISTTLDPDPSRLE